MHAKTTHEDLVIETWLADPGCLPFLKIRSLSMEREGLDTGIIVFPSEVKALIEALAKGAADLTADAAEAGAGPTGARAGGEPLICLGYLRLDRPGDLAPGSPCAQCTLPIEGPPWVALMSDGGLCGPLCALCAHSE